MKSLLLSMVFLGIVACSSSETKNDGGADGGGDMAPPSCEAFHDLCHDLMTAKAQECNDLAHKKGVTEMECAAKKAECLAACTPPDGSASDVKVTDSAGDVACKMPGASCTKATECCSMDCHIDHCD